MSVRAGVTEHCISWLVVAVAVAVVAVAVCPVLSLVVVVVTRLNRCQ